MRWLLDGPLGCFDTESTGINVEEDRIVTATVGTLLPGAPWAVDTHSWLINPGVDIPAEATAVHGITTEQAKTHGEWPPEVPLQDIVEAVARLFVAKIPVIGMNVAFDFTLLDRECRRHHLPTVDECIGRSIGPVVDVFVLDKWLDPYRKGSRNLTAACTQYGVRIDGAHDSAFDALAAARIAYRMASMSTWDRKRLLSMYSGRREPAEVADRFAMLAMMDPGALHTNQIRWRAEQCDSLRAHFDKSKTPHDGVPGDWPLIPWKGNTL